MLCYVNFEKIVLPRPAYGFVVYLITNADYVCRRGYIGFSSPSVCLSVCPQHISKTKYDLKVLKLGVGNDLGIPYKW